MKKSFWIVVLVALVVLPMAVTGCKGKVDKPQEMPPAMTESPELGNMSSTAPLENVVINEPAQTVATETIPPTAAPEITVKPTAVAHEVSDNRSKDIQKALKNAGFYAGSVDGKIGPKTKKAIEAFQKAKGLKADGKVGPRTWAELEKYLTQ